MLGTERGLEEKSQEDVMAWGDVERASFDAELTPHPPSS